jgi:uncharacterized protein
MTMKRLLLALACLAAGALPAKAASFDCAKAATAVEKSIRANAELSKLDETAPLHLRLSGAGPVRRATAEDNERRYFLEIEVFRPTG